MKLTIVLTVFNKEQYLHKAFDALLAQVNVSEDYYEILVVNDGSSDNSAVIIDDMANVSNRIRLITQENQGLSMARNNGMDAARGEYVWFVDADDIISPNSVYLICKAIESTPDIIPIYAKTEGIDKVRNAIPPEVKTGKGVLLSGLWQQCGVFYVYRKNFLKENDLRFLPGIYHEDAEFTPRMLYAAKSVQVVPEVLYTVIRDPNSITQVPRAKRAFDDLIVAERVSKFVTENKEDSTLIGRIIDESISIDINNAFSIICKNDKEEQRMLDLAFFEKKEFLLRSLKNAIQRKYHIEACLFSLFPKNYVRVYKLMQSLSGYLLGKRNDQ